MGLHNNSKFVHENKKFKMAANTSKNILFNLGSFKSMVLDTKAYPNHICDQGKPYV